jgi:helix-turn-helix protein
MKNQKKAAQGRDRGSAQRRAEPLAARVGRIVRTLRLRRELTLEQLAGLAGTDAGSLSRIERGKQGWSDKSLEALANALRVHVSTLFEPPAWLTQAPGDPPYVLIPSFSGGGASSSHLPPDGIPFPRVWLPHGSRASDLVVIIRRSTSGLPNLLVDTAATTIEDGKLYAFMYLGEERVRRAFLRFDRSVRLTVDRPSPEASEEIVPANAIDELHVIGRVVWGGGPL